MKLPNGDRLQFLWWGFFRYEECEYACDHHCKKFRWPAFEVSEWPRHDKGYLFKSWYFGWFEFRLLYNKPRMKS